MRVFNHDWVLIGEHMIQDLLTLEREGAIYADHWQDELNDFRHVQIRFAPEEIAEYVRSNWACELYLRAGSPKSARDVPEIPKDIAERADSYVMHTKYRETFGPPYHCAAAFYGEDLERLIFLNERSEVVSETGKQSLLSTVKRGIDALAPSIRLFTNREKGLAEWPITREDDVRDLLFVMLRASIDDIRREEAVPSRAGTHKYVDLCSKVARLFIEVKWISKSGTWKQFVKQINDDIQSYVAHPACETLVFVIIDAAKDIPDPSQLQQEMSGTQVIDGKSVEIYLFVREP